MMPEFDRQEQIVPKLTTLGWRYNRIPERAFYLYIACGISQPKPT